MRTTELDGRLFENTQMAERKYKRTKRMEERLWKFGTPSTEQIL